MRYGKHSALLYGFMTLEKPLMNGRIIFEATAAELHMRSHLLALGLWQAIFQSLLTIVRFMLPCLQSLHITDNFIKMLSERIISDGKLQLCQLTTLTSHFDYFRQLEPNFQLRSWQLEELPFGKVCQAVDKLKKVIKKQADLRFKTLYSLMLNVLTTSDAYASKNAPNGGTIKNPHATNLTREELSDIENQFPFYNNTQLTELPFVPKDSEPNKMQREIVQNDTMRIILNAGCGEGKTAAALLFAQKLLRENQIDRIIFTLPTKFTANNLSKDLTDDEKYAIS